MPRDLDQVRRDLKRGLSELKAAQRGYEVASAYYDGDDPEIFVSDALRVYLREQVTAFRLNLASVPVDTVADRLSIASFTSPEDAVTEAVSVIAAENDLWQWANDTMREAEKLGDYYVGIWIGPDGHPVLSPLDPMTTRVIYDTELERIPEYAIRFWSEDAYEDEEVIRRATVSYSDEIWKFVSTDGGDWEPYRVEGEPFPLKNTTGQLPIKHFRNRMPYGIPGHIKAYGMQQVITKSILNMMANVDFMGFRQRYALKNPEQFNGVPSPTPRTKDGVAVTPTEGVRAGLTAGPGRMWNLVAEAVGEFSPTDAEQFLKLLDWAIISMARATRLPVRNFTDASGQQPSGDSQRESDKALRDLIGARKRSFGAAWSDVMETSMAILGVQAEVNVEWERDEIISEKEWWEGATLAADMVQRALTDDAFKPFVQQKLLEAGYSTEEVDEFLSGSIETVSAMTDAPDALDTPAVEDNPGEPGTE